MFLNHFKDTFTQTLPGDSVCFTPNGCKGARLKENLSSVNAVYADFDFKPKAITGDAKPDYKQFMLDLDDLPTPTFVVESGNGWHLYWLLDKSIEVNDDNREELIKKVEGIHRYLHIKYGSDSGAMDVLRLMRQPGYEHKKQPEHPFMVELIEDNDDTRYTLEELLEAMPPIYKEVVEMPEPSGQDDFDIRQVAIDAWAEKGDEVSFDTLGRLIWNGQTTGTFIGRQGQNNYIATTSDEYPHKGNPTTYVAGVLELTNKEAYKWLVNKYGAPMLGESELDMETLHYKETKNGRTYSPSLYNAMKIIEHYKVCKYDEFKCRYFIKEDGEWVVRADEVDMRLYERMAKDYQFMTSASLGVVRSAITKVSMDNRYDSARQYCESLSWDGEARLDHWLSKVFGVEECQYHTDIGADWFKGMVNRMVVPGCKFDHALIIKGGQGIGKSSAFLNLCGGFADGINSTEFTDAKDKQLIEEIQGKVIAEFSEGAVFRKADQETVKSIITRQFDRLRVPYEAHARDFPRRCVFAVTTNKDGFLKDDTGNRRWWPVDCGDYQHLVPSERPKADLDWLEKNRDQLFAEAYHRVINLKESCHNVDEAELEKRQTPFEDEHDDADLYTAAYNSLGEGTKLNGVTIRMVYNKAFPSENEVHLSKSTQMAIASVLKNPKGLNLVKDSRFDTNYWVPRDPLANFEVGITEEEAEKRIQAMIEKEEDY